MSRNYPDEAITEEGLAELRSRIGKEYLLRGWNTEATKDAIWHFAEGIGDDNPLWVDEQYARKTKWKGIIASPTFLSTFSSFSGAQAATGLPGAHALWAEDDWTFCQPVRVGDRITASYKVADILEKEGRWGSLHQYEEITYQNQREEIVGNVRRLYIRAGRDTARVKGKCQPVAKYRYTEAELKAIEEDYDKEERRGAQIRWWEDVKVGDDIGQVVKGPLTVTEMIVWLMGWGSPLCKASRIAHLYMRKHPAVAISDPATGVPDFPERAHWDEPFAQACGIGGGYDIGIQRISWFAHLVTNWTGDDGFLKKLRVQLRRPHWLGDTLWIRGKISQKYYDGEDRLVECELWADNQRGERVALGWATAALPLRHGCFQLDRWPLLPY